MPTVPIIERSLSSMGRSWSETYVPVSPKPDQIFASLDVDDSGNVSIDEVLHLGRECDAYWVDWTSESIVELAGASAGVTNFSLAEFTQFCEAAAPWGTAEKVRSFVEAGNKRRAMLDPFDPARVEAAFEALDIDDSGYIELPELLHFGIAIGAGWTQAACEALLGRMDTDGDHKISLSEFEAFVSEVGLHGCHDEVAAFIEAGEARRKLNESFDETQLQRAFRALDIDDSGYIELPELLHFGATVGAGWTQAACETLLKKADVDRDQKISFSEFEGFVREVGLHGCHEEVAAFIRAGEMRRSLNTSDEEADEFDEGLELGAQSI